MKALIVYQSKTGFTEKYARMVAEATGCDCKRLEDVQPGELAGYELVVYGGRVHAGFIGGLKRFRKLLPQGQAFALFATGASPAEAESIPGMWRANLAEDELSRVPHFYMPSGLNYAKMGFADKLLMRMLVSALKAKKNRTSAEEAMAQTLGQSFDNSSDQYAEPLIAYLRNTRDESERQP